MIVKSPAFSQIILIIKCEIGVQFQTGAVHTDYYLDSDLTIGSFINVWGRKFQVCDCDDFTKDFYASKYGLGKKYSAAALTKNCKNINKP